MSPSPETEVRETILVVAELIQSQMQLENGVVSIYNQRRKLGKGRGLQVDVALLGNRPFSVRSRSVNDPARPDLVERQCANEQETIQVDVFSYDDSARLRRIEVLFALTGVAAQQACEKYAMKIARVPASFVDLSEGEGAGRLNRFALTFNVLRGYSIERTVETFSTFTIPPQLVVNP
jgi:hypothetical protein